MILKKREDLLINNILSDLAENLLYFTQSLEYINSPLTYCTDEGDILKSIINFDYEGETQDNYCNCFSNAFEEEVVILKDFSQSFYKRYNPYPMKNEKPLICLNVIETFLLGIIFSKMYLENINNICKDITIHEKLSSYRFFDEYLGKDIGYEPFALGVNDFYKKFNLFADSFKKEMLEVIPSLNIDSICDKLQAYDIKNFKIRITTS